MSLGQAKGSHIFIQASFLIHNVENTALAIPSQRDRGEPNALGSISHQLSSGNPDSRFCLLSALLLLLLLSSVVSLFFVVHFSII